MASGSIPSSPRPGRPPATYFVLVVVLVAIGVLAPLLVSKYQNYRAAQIPVDTTGNRPDSAPPAPLPTDSANPHD